MLELDRLSRRYGDVVALDDLSFTVRPGQMYGFVGTNGAGKTTAMRIVLGVLSPDSGTVRWQGRTVDRDMRREFGYMPEERGLYPKMRVFDQLVYLAQLYGVARTTARQTAGDLLDMLALGERASDRVEALSLGNQQRVQLAAALIHDPAVLVLDEPFSGLDPMGVDAMAGVLRARVDAGAAVVFSSHQLELVERLCDAVGIVRAGRMVADGTVEQLRGEAARRYRIHVDAGPGWVGELRDRLPGVTVVDGSAPDALVELAPDVDDQKALDTARALGPVRQFTPVRSTLTELFREAVTDGAGDDAGTHAGDHAEESR
ncbi:ABC-2 type transport system ATP-binding protein [Haloactinopolyspora alba]|uniref:ABC-2 type transport system ATP-binding protein n=1 Tax=Haloactinopolyspora alba TaxID=648780 RepID=A0A2P8E2K9_9ACTN|nr:ATP-binding cassette domain-containing protein [Haloactinopolyspora alba]PSL03719.1 ABC-2 type transport system ATP-binding protein [Haloactinopolyspora alba]